MLTKEELLAKAKKPAEDAMRLHPLYKGKIETVPKCAVRSLDDFSIWYTPGVAAPCKAIQHDKELAYQMTNKGNTVAIVTDGTRVLGLGDIGPEAGMPVMEGKALIFKYLGGVDAVPICLDTKDPENIINATKWLQPSFGGINLEDISQPKCFYILDRLKAECSIPVWHDDQQGTATVLLVGLINALKIVGKRLGDVSVAMVGAGAANIAIARLLHSSGIKPANTIMVDSKGILNKRRSDIESRQTEYADKWRICQTTNAGNRAGGIAEALRGADVCISLSQPGPDVIKKEWVATMGKDAILFACANPIPEIWPWDAKEAGVRIMGTGRSDFPNQLNNSLVFPGLFRGALDVRAKTITDEMCIAAAFELAKCAEEKGLNEEFIAPNMDQWDIFPREAVAVGMKAQELGVAGVKIDADELYQQATATIKRARAITEDMMREGSIAPIPEL
ncbi:MAG: NADP-dependent malic enzyme [Chloroflexi bacterium]|nr:NADP-dependent malic enzyme [Chloroflexota bacterium]